MIPKPSIRLGGGFIAAFFAASLSHAAEDEQPLSIVITGSRTAQTVEESLAPVTVIEREQIEQRPNDTVADLLRLTPGVTVTNNGGKGSQTSVFLRGTESDHTLILIDGVRVGSATTGMAAIQNLSPSQIERIEVVRGPRSSLYGSEAIGGVIQIFTRRPQQDMRPDFSVSGGSHSSYSLNAGLSGRADSSWYSAQLSTFETEGFNACRGKPFPNGGGCFTDEPDDDGYQNNSLSLAAGAQLGSRVNASFNALHADSELEFDGSIENEQEATNQLISAKMEIMATEKWDIDLLASVTKDYSDNFKDGVFSSRFDTDRELFTFQNDFHAGKSGLFTLGLDYYEDEVSGTTDYAVDSRDNIGIFGQYLGQLEALDTQLSLRGDDNEQFGSATTGGISVGQAFGDGMRWTASYGSAFKAPTFNELYFPGFGNPNLEAETSDTIDLGVSGRSDTLRFSANAYDTRIEDMIAFDALTYSPVNIGEARIVGLELTLGSSLFGWEVDAVYNLISAKNESAGPFQDNQLARRPEQSFNLMFGHQVGKFSTLIDLHAQGHSYDDLANTQRLAGFTTINLNLGYAVTNSWSLQLAINNLLDKEYETAQYYNQDGLNGMLTLRYTPK